MAQPLIYPLLPSNTPPQPTWLKLQIFCHFWFELILGTWMLPEGRSCTEISSLEKRDQSTPLPKHCICSTVSLPCHKSILWVICNYAALAQQHNIQMGIFWWICIRNMQKMKRLEWLTSLILQCDVRRSVQKTSQELGNCPMEIWLKFWNLVQILKFGQNPEIWSKSLKLLETQKLGQNPEIWSRSWNLVEILKFGQKPEILLKFWNLV